MSRSRTRPALAVAAVAALLAAGSSALAGDGGSPAGCEQKLAEAGVTNVVKTGDVCHAAEPAVDQTALLDCLRSHGVDVSDLLELKRAVVAHQGDPATEAAVAACA